MPKQPHLIKPVQKRKRSDQSRIRKKCRKATSQSKKLVGLVTIRKSMDALLKEYAQILISDAASVENLPEKSRVKKLGAVNPKTKQKIQISHSAVEAVKNTLYSELHRILALVAKHMQTEKRKIPRDRDLQKVLDMCLV